jgi:hypothetical protein
MEFYIFIFLKISRYVFFLNFHVYYYYNCCFAMEKKKIFGMFAFKFYNLYQKNLCCCFFLICNMSVKLIKFFDQFFEKKNYYEGIYKVIKIEI